MDSQPTRPKSQKDSVLSYAAVFVMMGIALALTFVIYEYVRPMISPLFLFAVVIIAWRFGLKQAILGTFLAGVMIDYFFIEPANKLSIGSNDLVRLAIFFFEGVGFSLLINSRKKAAEAVKSSKEQLLALSVRESAAREEERRRVSLEVHDELGQSLTSLKMQLHLLKKRAQDQFQSAEGRELAADIEPLLGVVDDTIQSVRRIASELRPPVLDDLGLVPALEWQVHEFRRRTGIQCTFKTNVENPSIIGDGATAVFRIFQEALTNVARHANAKNVLVILQDIGSGIELRIEDDGVGFKGVESEWKTTSLGIIGMQERARNIGGDVKVASGAERGTVVTLRAPAFS